MNKKITALLLNDRTYRRSFPKFVIGDPRLIANSLMAAKSVFRYIILLFCTLLITTPFVFGADPAVREESLSAIVTFAAQFEVKERRHVSRISPYQYQNEPNFVVVGSYEYKGIGNATVTNIEIEYYINNNISTTKTLSLLSVDKIPAPNELFESAKLALPSGVDVFSYRFVIVYDNNENNKTYYPYNANEWINITVVDNSTATIGASGGTIILDHGDQRYDNSKMIIDADTFSYDSLITMSESNIDNFSGNKTGVLKLYEINSSLPLSKNANVTLYYGSSNDGQYVVKYFDGTSWKKVSPSAVQDTANKTISFTTKERGYYGIFDKSDDEDSGHRPKYRVFTPGNEIEFRNLQQGDTVTIYDINGRQVRKLTSAPFKWNGRKDGGGYAESGSYIYQIKVDGKIISGSIVFAR
jgi:hypothetical protein